MIHSVTSTFSADLFDSGLGTYATMASCAVPAEKIILPTKPEQPLRSSASGSGSAFIACIAVSSSDWSPSGDSMVVQKKSRPPISAAPSISTPFLPPSLMTVLSTFSFAFAASLAALSSADGSTLTAFSFSSSFGLAAFSAFIFSISSGEGLPLFFSAAGASFSLDIAASLATFGGAAAASDALAFEPSAAAFSLSSRAAFAGITVSVWPPFHEAFGTRTTGLPIAAASRQMYFFHSSEPRSASVLAFASPMFHTTASGKPILSIRMERSPSTTWSERGVSQ